MLTGRLPFAADQADPMAVAMRHLEAAPPPMGADVPPAVEAVVMNALRKRPEHRPDALHLGQDLARAAGGRQRRRVRLRAQEELRSRGGATPRR